MSEPTGAKGPIEEFETELFRSLDRYFEVRRREVEESIERAGTEFKNFEEARRQLMEAEQKLEQIQQRTAEIKGEALNTIVESSEVCGARRRGIRGIRIGDGAQRAGGGRGECPGAQEGSRRKAPEPNGAGHRRAPRRSQQRVGSHRIGEGGGDRRLEE